MKNQVLELQKTKLGEIYVDSILLFENIGQLGKLKAFWLLLDS